MDASGVEGASDGTRSLIPARLDRLPWTRFHSMMIVALGITWVLDGIEISVAGNVASRWTSPAVFHVSTATAAASASWYLAGEVVGALFFGKLADLLGRRKLFLVTVGLYMVANALTAVAWTWPLLIGFRVLAGMGIGGEYAAINSAIDELVPAKHRGVTDLCVNGTYWLGAAIGAGITIPLLSSMLPADVGWRIAFLLGPVVVLAIIGMRRRLPESPRWLLTHGHFEEAERVTAGLEERARAEGHSLETVPPDRGLTIKPREKVTYREITRIMIRKYPGRSLLALTLFVTQSFLYNAIFFTYSLLLHKYYHIPASSTGYYFFFFAAGNLAGPFVLGRFFDSVGRKQMITLTYVTSGILLAMTGYLFKIGVLTALTQTALWSVIFFIASAAASSAYLTSSEIFPVELRSQAISYFFAIGQLVGGVAAPAFFGALIGSGSRSAVFVGYLAGAALMIAGGVVEAVLGVAAERRSLEDVAAPLAALHAVGGKMGPSPRAA